MANSDRLNENLYKNSLLFGYLDDHKTKSPVPQNATISQGQDIDIQNVEKRKKSIYKNVLTFPKDIDHLKYFEKNPHPDRISDKLQAISALYSNSPLNANVFQKKMEFEAVKKFLEPNLSDIEREIVRMPDKMQCMIDSAQDADFITAFTHLRDSFYNYFQLP